MTNLKFFIKAMKLVECENCMGLLEVFCEHCRYFYCMQQVLSVEASKKAKSYHQTSEVVHVGHLKSVFFVFHSCMERLP